MLPPSWLHPDIGLLPRVIVLVFIEFTGFNIRITRVIQSFDMSEPAGYKAAKLTRRNAKASLTRSRRGLLHRITNQRSVDEVQETFANVEKVYDDLVQKHEKFTELIEEDKEFEVEEHWLEECQGQFLNLKSRTKEYVQETLNEKGLSEKADNEQKGITVDDETTENENTSVEEISSGTQVETPHNQNNEQG